MTTHVDNALQFRQNVRLDSARFEKHALFGKLHLYVSEAMQDGGHIFQITMLSSARVRVANCRLATLRQSDSQLRVNLAGGRSKLANRRA